MFGPRTLGQPLSRQAGPAASDAAAGVEAGALTGAERFLRENRNATDFVGVDRAEANTFVGAGQVIQSGRVRSAIESLQNPPDLSSQLNRPWRPAAVRSPYAPRLELQFTSGDPSRFWHEHPPKINSFEWNLPSHSGDSSLSNPWDSNQDTAPAMLGGSSTPDSTSFNLDLSKRIRRAGSETLEVYLNGRTAILRGSVANPRQRQLAELLIGFEPGIAKVRNEIVVANP